MIATRRRFFGLGAALAAPLVVPYGRIMPVKAWATPKPEGVLSFWDGDRLLEAFRVPLAAISGVGVSADALMFTNRFVHSAPIGPFDRTTIALRGVGGLWEGAVLPVSINNAPYAMAGGSEAERLWNYRYLPGPERSPIFERALDLTVALGT